MNRIKRTLQRIAILALGVLSIWLIVFVFRIVDRRLPWIIALAFAYGAGAYFILPRAVRMGLKVLQRKHVPRYTVTGDGLPGDPVNLGLAGTSTQLSAAFSAAGWARADRLTITSAWQMAWRFLLNQPYPTAPFSTLYLFGRGQDIGFQKAIGDSPRKRHHVRFWAQSLAYARADAGTIDFWFNAHQPNADEHVLWVGAGTRDTGFSLTRLTFQITHATDSDTNVERDYIMGELEKIGAIGNVTFYKAGDQLRAKAINHYITDGEIALAELEVKPDTRRLS